MSDQVETKFAKARNFITLPVAVVILVGFILSITAFVIFDDIEEEKELAEFKSEANQLAELMDHKIAGAMETVQSLAALYAASEKVERHEFSKFAKIEMRGQPNIQAIEWIPRVKESERGAFESRARQDGLTDFTFTERHAQGKMVRAARRDEYYPVYFVEPFKGNEAALGFDLASNPTRLKALNAARDSGRLQVTARITLVQETGKSFGVLVFQPIYQNGDIPETIAERRKQLIGFGLGVLRISSILDVKKTEFKKQKQMQAFVFDQTAPAGQQVLFPPQSPYEVRENLALEHCFDNKLSIGGRSWLVAHCAFDQHDSFADHQTSWFVLAAGLLLTIMLAAYLWMLDSQKSSRQKVIDQLRSSQNLLQAFFDNSTSAINIKDLDGKFLMVNTLWEKWFNPETRDETKLRLEDLNGSAHKSSVAELDQMIAKTEKPHQKEISTELADGKVITSLMQKFPIFDVEKKLISIGTINTDISEQKKAEEKIQEIAEDLARLVDTANAPIFGIDTMGLINEWNQAAERITGFTKEYVIGRDLVDEFVADDNKVSVKHILGQALRGAETANYEFSLLTNKGKRVEMLLNSTTRRDGVGNIVGVIGIGQDITERNKVNAEREHLVRAVENLNECVALFDNDDRLIYSNEAYQQLNKGLGDVIKIGVRFEDSIRAGAIGGFVPDAKGREEEWIAERMDRHLNPTGPYEVKRQDGITIFVNEQNLDGGGRILIMSDITELKQSQAQVIQSSKLATLGEMATSVAHELNQPLNVIRMGAGNVLRKIEKGKLDPEYLQNKMERISSQTERAANIIDHMRMFGRKAEEKPKKISPADAVRGALDLMGEQLRLAEIEVQTDLPEQEIEVLGHRIQLEQVILNLLTNARDAVEANGGDKTIKLSIENGDDAVRIITQDSGGGIPNDVIDRIFEPFYTTKEMGKGTGLGLSVSYGIIRDMSGQISAENTDIGAKFVIILPVAEVSAATG